MVRELVYATAAKFHLGEAGEVPAEGRRHWCDYC